MMRAWFAGAALLALSIAPAEAAHWTVDAAKSKLGFTVQWAGAPFVATFKSWKADIDFDPADLAHAHAVVAVDLDSETSDAPDNDDGLKGAQGFQVSQFPTAHFETTSFAHTGGNAYVASGKLTIHGLTRPVTLPFTLTISGDKAHMTGKAQIVRTDYGVGQGEWASEKVVAHLVSVDIDIQAVKGH
jgi:polyisoprenoid-binding protein YceI